MLLNLSHFSWKYRVSPKSNTRHTMKIFHISLSQVWKKRLCWLCRNERIFRVRRDGKHLGGAQNIICRTLESIHGGLCVMLCFIAESS